MPSEAYFKQRLEELEPGVRSRASPPNICFKRKWCESNIEGAPGCDSPWHCAVIGRRTLPRISGFNLAPRPWSSSRSPSPCHACFRACGRTSATRCSSTWRWRTSTRPAIENEHIFLIKKQNIIGRPGGARHYQDVRRHDCQVRCQRYTEAPCRSLPFPLKYPAPCEAWARLDPARRLLLRALGFP